MILQSLVQYYENKSELDPTLPRFGYSNAKVSYALNIDLDGKLLDLLPLKETVARGKKMSEVPRNMTVPNQPVRSSGIRPYFLADNATYILGIPKESKKKDEASWQNSKNLTSRQRSISRHAKYSTSKCYKASNPMRLGLS